MISPENRQLLIEFATHGFEFFPLIKPAPGRKLGTPKSWPDLGTDDIATINSWLPTSKYGFGMTFGSRRYFAFDLDGAEGVANFEAAMAAHNIPHPSIIFKTPSGGRHLLYKYPDDVKIKNISGWCFDKQQSKQGTKIDIRADGGFIGSFGARENRYVLVHGSAASELVELPSTVPLPIQETKASLVASSLSLTKDLVMAQQGTDVASPLYGEIPSIIYDGDRDNTLFNLVASWVRAGLSKGNIMILLREALRRCEGDASDIPIEDMVDRTMCNPDFMFAKRSNALQSMLKSLVFVHDINRFVTLHDSSIMTKAAAETRFANVQQEVELKSGKSKWMPVFNIWQRDEARLMVANIGYKPGDDTVYIDGLTKKKMVNTYRSPDITPVRNDVLFAKFVDFAITIVGDDKEKGKMLVEFIAYLVQKPAHKIGIAPVIISTKQGIGKNFFLKIVSELLGETNVTSLHSDNIASNFNSAMAQYQLVVVNESVGDNGLNKLTKSKNEQAMSRIKSMITDYNQSIERKGVDITTVKTYGNFMFFSNDISAISMSMEDRRFRCFINELPPKGKDYFDSMDVLKTAEGQSAIMFGLKTLELARIGDYMTSYDKSVDDLRVINSSYTPMEQDISQDIDEGRGIFAGRFTSKELFMMYMSDRHGERISMSMCGKLMRTFFEPLRINTKSKNCVTLKIDMPSFIIEGDQLRGGPNRENYVYQLKASGLVAPITGDKIDRYEVAQELLKCVKLFQSEKETMKGPMQVIK